MASKFQKRHYEALARVFQDARASVTFEGEVLGIAAVKHELANMLARDNPDFNKGRFMLACEPGANVRARG